MSEIDPVILQLRADTDRYVSDLRNTTTKAENLLGRQEKQVKMLEDQFSQSSESIKGSITSIAAALAAGFSAEKIIALADAFTRFENSLKVTELAGDDLARVEEKLFAIANKNGIAIEGVGTLYSRAAQNANVLGASQTDLIHLNEAVASTFKISGATTEGAAGAMLGLGQALGSSRVQTEDFNQMLEGGLLPLLQEAAKHIEGTGGTVAGLKNRLGDMKTAGVSNVQLFTAIIASMDALDKKASLASGTISGAFTQLENQLTRYVGSMDKAEGASAILTGALDKLANNLDVIIPALATISVYMGVRYAGSLALATLATIAKVAADVRATQSAAALAAAQIEVAGMMNAEAIAAARAAAAVTDLSVAQGVAARAGSGLLSLVGGPVVAAILALAAGVVYLNYKLEENSAANAAYATALDQAKQASEHAADAADKLASAHGKARVEALAAAKAEEENVKQKLLSAKASLALAEAELTRAKAYQDAQNTASVGSTGVPGSGMYIQGTGDVKVAQAKGNVDTAKATVQTYQDAINKIQKAIAAPEFKAAVAPVKAKKQHGPTAEQIEAKHEEEMARLRQEELQAQLDVTTDATDKAQISRQILEAEYKERSTKINADKYYTDAQKKAQIAELNKLYGVRGRGANGEILVDGKGGLLGKSIWRDEIEAYEKQDAEKAKAEYEARKDALQAQYDLADSTDERRKIALDLVDLDYQYQKAQAEADKNSQISSDVEKQQADAKLKTLDAQHGFKVTAAQRANESPLQTEARTLNKSDGALNDQIEGYVVDELNSVRDSIRNAITKQLGITNDPLINGLLNMLIEQVLLKPIANALSNAKDSASGGGGFLSSIVSGIGTLFGRASGGPVQAGQMYRVNEAANSGNVEAFVPSTSGQIIPLGRTNATRGGGGRQNIFQISVDARNSVTPAGFAQALSSTILQQAASMDVQMGKAVTSSVPGRISQYQRDGS